MFLAIDPAYVSSHCPLLPDEVAEDYLPRAFMRIPRHSAWVALQVKVDDFADVSGTLDETALERALCERVDEGERLHDSIGWSDPRLQRDSWRNRRLAIALRGWGDLIALRDSDPAELATLRALEEVAHWCCDTVQTHSRQMAARRRWCPALDEAGDHLRKAHAGLSWNSRWRKALSNVAVRHRNLTTMSPWDVFKRQHPANLRNIDLLPVLRFADSLSFQCDVSFSHWNTNEFNGFCSRLTAVTKLENGQSCVAEQV